MNLTDEQAAHDGRGPGTFTLHVEYRPSSFWTRARYVGRFALAIAIFILAGLPALLVWVLSGRDFGDWLGRFLGNPWD